MHLRPIEHLENRRPKCKMHTQERQLTRFFLYFTTDLQRKPIGRFFKTEPAVFLKTEPKPNQTLKNQFRTSLDKSCTWADREF